MPDTTPSMPPLPEPAHRLKWEREDAYTADQMRAFRADGVRDALERDALRGALTLAGKMSEAARNLVGGKSITLGVHAPGNVYNIGDLAEALREATDDYDAAILEMARNKP